MTDLAQKTRKRPCVSVIVTAYNQEKYIGRCIRSLIQQTMPSDEYEIIIVNDGSTDLTQYTIEQFSNGFQSTIKVFKNSTNIGLPASLNIGIRASEADFIVRVDSDDFVNENFLTFLYQFLIQNPDLDAVASDYYLTDNEEKVLRRCNCQEEPIGCSIMFRTHQLIEIGLYDEEFRRLEERELRRRFEQKFQIARLEIPLYRYRQHETNITNDMAAMKKYEKKLASKFREKKQNG